MRPIIFLLLKCIGAGSNLASYYYCSILNLSVNDIIVNTVMSIQLILKLSLLISILIMSSTSYFLLDGIRLRHEDVKIHTTSHQLP